MDVYRDQIRVLVEDARMSVLEMWLWTNSQREYARTTHNKDGIGFLSALKDAKASEQSIPQEVKQGEVGRTTVFRWIVASNATYVTHQKGFADRRNDEDVLAERRHFNVIVNNLEQRQPYWRMHKGRLTHIDQLRSEDPDIENLETWPGQTPWAAAAAAAEAAAAAAAAAAARGGSRRE